MHLRGLLTGGLGVQTGCQHGLPTGNQKQELARPPMRNQKQVLARPPSTGCQEQTRVNEKGWSGPLSGTRRKVGWTSHKEPETGFSQGANRKLGEGVCQVGDEEPGEGTGRATVGEPSLPMKTLTMATLTLPCVPSSEQPPYKHPS